MKISILYFALCFLTSTAFAGNTSTSDTTKKIVVKPNPKIKKKKNKVTTSPIATTPVVNQPTKPHPNPMPIAPTYKEGQQAMLDFIKSNLKVPEEVKKNNVLVTAYVVFTVGIDGKLKNIHSLKIIGMGCDEEAERVVRLMPDWNPGKIGKTLKEMEFTLSIEFK